MKKRLWSLLVAGAVFSASAMMPLGVSADIAPLEPFVFTQDFEETGITVDDLYTKDGTDDGDDEAVNDASAFRAATGVPLTLERYASQATATDPVSVKIIEEEDGNKLLRVLTWQDSDSVASKYQLNAPVVSGKVEASMEFGPDSGGGGAWHLFGFTGTTSNTNRLTVTLQGGWKAYGTSDSIVNPQTNAKGRYELRCVASRSGPDETWKIEMYDDSGDVPVLCYETETSQDFGAISAVQPFYVWASNPKWQASFDNYCVKVTPYPSVLEAYDGCRGAQPDAETMTIRFDGALPTNEPKLKLVKVSDAYVVIGATTTYDSETGDLTIAPDGFLEYATDYRMEFEGGGVTNHVFTTAEKPITIVSETWEYTPDGGTSQNTKPESGIYSAKVTIRIKKAASVTDAKKAVIMLHAYDAKGAIIAASAVKQIPVIPTAGINANQTLQGLDASKVARVEAVIWENDTEVGYIPLP